MNKVPFSAIALPIALAFSPGCEEVDRRTIEVGLFEDSRVKDSNNAVTAALDMISTGLENYNRLTVLHGEALLRVAQDNVVAEYTTVGLVKRGSGFAINSRCIEFNADNDSYFWNHNTQLERWVVHPNKDGHDQLYSSKVYDFNVDIEEEIFGGVKWTYLQEAKAGDYGCEPSQVLISRFNFKISRGSKLDPWTYDRIVTVDRPEGPGIPFNWSENNTHVTEQGEVVTE